MGSLINPTGMRHRYPEIDGRIRAPLWQRFDSIRTKETCGDRALLLNIVSLAIHGPCTDREVVEAIAGQSSRPVPIHSLPDVLSETRLVRGKSMFGLVGDEIDKVAINFEVMHWWISKEGLNMAIVSPKAAKLSRFDEFAGKLCVDRSKDGKLSKELLVAIAKEVDVAGFTLKEQLQPAQWRPIAEYNQTKSRQAIKTFEQACQPLFARSVRRRLYVARERYTKANPLVLPLPRVS
jgi:hypothetical protein